MCSLFLSLHLSLSISLSFHLSLFFSLCLSPLSFSLSLSLSFHLSLSLFFSLSLSRSLSPSLSLSHTLTHVHNGSPQQTDTDSSDVSSKLVNSLSTQSRQSCPPARHAVASGGQTHRGGSCGTASDVIYRAHASSAHTR